MIVKGDFLLVLLKTWISKYAVKIVKIRLIKTIKFIIECKILCFLPVIMFFNWKRLWSLLLTIN